MQSVHPLLGQRFDAGLRDKTEATFELVDDSRRKIVSQGAVEQQTLVEAVFRQIGDTIFKRILPVTDGHLLFFYIYFSRGGRA